MVTAEVEVRREDQDKINKFSRLHQRELAIEEDLKTKNVGTQSSCLWLLCRASVRSWANIRLRENRKRKRSSTTCPPNWNWPMRTRKFSMSITNPVPYFRRRANENLCRRYKIGDAFFHIPLEQAQEMLEASSTKIDEETTALEEKMSVVREEMTQLKVDLYARFGKQINLEI